MDIDSGENNIEVTRGGRPRKSENLLKNEWREETITKARVSPNVLKSLQPCLLNQNLDVLKSCLKNTNSNQKKDKINGLAAVLTFLLAGEICENGTEQESSFMLFDSALEIFLGYQRNHTVNSLDRNVRRQFLLVLLNQKYGLCVFVWYSQTQNKTFVLARPDNVDLTSFLQHIDRSTIMPKREGLELTKESFQMILQSADTEYDRKLLKAVAGACKSWKELEELGIDPRIINDITTSVLSSAAECSNAHKASLDIVKQRLVSKIQQLQEEKSSKERILLAKSSVWTPARLGDVQEEIKAIEERIDGMQSLLNPSSSYEKQKVNQMAKRQADQLIKANRIKGRTLSNQGPKEKNNRKR